MTMKTLILDRDGVINADAHGYIDSVENWHPCPGSLAAIARLHRAGWQLFVATNQSGIGRGLYDLATMHAIHAWWRDHINHGQSPIGWLLQIAASRHDAGVQLPQGCRGRDASFLRCQYNRVHRH